MKDELIYIIYLEIKFKGPKYVRNGKNKGVFLVIPTNLIIEGLKIVDIVQKQWYNTYIWK